MAEFVRGYFSLCVFFGTNVKLQAFFLYFWALLLKKVCS